MVDVPLGFHDFRVLLRPAEPSLRDAAKPDFTAIVSARDEADALAEAEKVVETLNWAVSVVSIETYEGRPAG
jgi:hypothetical protein